MAQETCKCGAVYEVTYRRTPIPDTDTADCEVCGARLASWRQSTSWPDYQLISRPNE